MLRLSIASPCTEKWETMQGDERSRHCATCELNVYNIKNLSENEVLALLSTGSRVCGRLFQRPDGTVLTRDCPVGLRKVRRQVVAGLTAAAALFLAAFSLRGPAACPSTLPNGGTPIDRAKSELAHAEDWLRHTRTFGPIVEWLDPEPMVTAGLIMPPTPVVLDPIVKE